MKITIGIGWYILPPLLVGLAFGFKAAVLTLLFSLGMTFLLVATMIIASILRKGK